MVIKETKSQVTILENGREYIRLKSTSYAEICHTFNEAKALLQKTIIKNIQKAERNLQHVNDISTKALKKINKLKEKDI